MRHRLVIAAFPRSARQSGRDLATANKWRRQLTGWMARGLYGACQCGFTPGNCRPGVGKDFSIRVDIVSKVSADRVTGSSASRTGVCLPAYTRSIGLFSLSPHRIERISPRQRGVV